jgi:hypothetical protein
VIREKTGILIMIGLRRGGNGNGAMLKTSQRNRRKNRGKLNGLVLDGKDGRISTEASMVLIIELPPAPIIIITI